jgi:uncharacterized protein
MLITAFYAGLLVPIFMLLSFRVIRQRRIARQSIGDGGDAHLLRLMRVHANFAEYVPFALLLMALGESLRTPAFLIHALGIVLLIGRVSHAYGVSCPNEKFHFRVVGMAATFTVLLVSALICLYQSLRSGVFFF